ncbi:MAG: hypothetical protein ACP5P2_00640 [Candidatus Micrarchaeia archaeon]|jgi:hypothetical protein
MVKYFKIYDDKEVLYVTIDDSGAAILRDKKGRKVFLSRYQARLMKFGVENLLQNLIKPEKNGNVHIEELSKEEFEKEISG